MLRRLLFCLLLFFSAPASADEGKERWVLQAGGSAIMVFEISRHDDGWSAIWERPEHFQFTEDRFSGISGAPVYRTARSVRLSDGALEMVFDGQPQGPPLTFSLRRENLANATLHFAGFGGDPVLVVRSTAPVTLGGWDPQQSYAVTHYRPTNTEMTAIFNADQAARKDLSKIDWKSLDAEDQQRRFRTQALLDAGRLNSADDYFHAAYVFQHGHDPADYLKAHALAVIAVARGNVAAPFIAAASLDRYLQSIGQPQVYGTQFSKPGGSWTQSPYRSDILSDAIRSASRVLTIKEQEAQLSKYQSTQ